MILSDPLSDSSIKSSLKVVGKPWTAVTEFPIVGGGGCWKSLCLWTLLRKMYYLFICYITKENGKVGEERRVHYFSSKL